MEGGILPSRQELLSRIELVCELDSSLIALTGEPGMGKSVLLEYFIERHCQEHNKCLIQATSELTPSQLKEQVLFSLFKDQLVDAGRSLADNVAACQFEQFQRVIIVIDNAEFVDSMLIDELIELLKTPIDNFQASVILAQSTDQERFTQINATHPLIEIHIEPLSKAESRMLLEYYYAQMMDSDRQEVQRFIERSEGNPAKLLTWQESSGAASVKGKKLNTTQLLIIVLSALLLLVVAAASWYFATTTKDAQTLHEQQLREKIKQQQGAQQSTPDDALANDAAAAHSETEDGNPDSAIKGAVNEQTDNDKAPVEDPSVNPLSTKSVTDELLAQPWDPKAQEPYVDKAIKQAAEQAKLDEQAKQARAAKKAQQQAERQDEQHGDEGEQAQADTQAGKTAESEDAVASSPSEAPVQDEQAPVQDEQASLGTQAQQPSANDTQQQQGQAKRTGSLLDSMDNRWFMAQNADAFVLQLTGVSDKETLESYLSFHKLGDKAHIYQSLRNGHPWYVVTYGVYGQIQQANAAKAELPANVKKDEPWAKKVRTIQTELLDAEKKAQ